MVIERRRDTPFAVLVIVLGLLVGNAGSALAASDSPVPAVNAEQGIGLKGYDPVSYFTKGAPTKGLEQYTFAWKGVTYRFASVENLDRFKLTQRNTCRSTAVTARTRCRLTASPTSILRDGLS